MLQINIWTALRELGVGANLQHYNPLVIDDAVRALCLICRRGSWEAHRADAVRRIVAEPDAKESSLATSRRECLSSTDAFPKSEVWGEPCGETCAVLFYARVYSLTICP